MLPWHQKHQKTPEKKEKKAVLDIVFCRTGSNNTNISTQIVDEVMILRENYIVYTNSVKRFDELMCFIYQIVTCYLSTQTTFNNLVQVFVSVKSWKRRCELLINNLSTHIMFSCILDNSFCCCDIFVMKTS